MPDKSEGQSQVEQFCFTSGGDLLVTCPCGVVWFLPEKSDLAGQSMVGRMNGSEDLTTPASGGWVGVTLRA